MNMSGKLGQSFDDESSLGKSEDIENNFTIGMDED